MYTLFSRKYSVWNFEIKPNVWSCLLLFSMSTHVSSMDWMSQKDAECYQQFTMSVFWKNDQILYKKLLPSIYLGCYHVLKFEMGGLSNSECFIHLKKIQCLLLNKISKKMTRTNYVKASLWTVEFVCQQYGNTGCQVF